MRKTCLNMVYELATKNKDIFFVGSDLGFNTLKEFKEAFPDRFFMEGIAEASVVGMAAGLALEGKIVYVNTIAPFITRRCYEQIVLDLCLHKVKVRLIGNGGGMVYAPLGPTHEINEDIAIMRVIPNMSIIAPCDAEEMARLMPQTVDVDGPLYIRLAKGYDPIVSDSSIPCEFGKSVLMQQGKDGLIVTTGITLSRALSAADTLQKKGVDVSVLHYHTVKPFDLEALLSIAEEVPIIITVEEHSISGGLGGIVAESIAEACFEDAKKFKRLGVPDMFPDDYGSQNWLLDRFKISAEEIVKTVLAFR
jgi:transketolase